MQPESESRSGGKGAGEARIARRAGTWVGTWTETQKRKRLWVWEQAWKRARAEAQADVWAPRAEALVRALAQARAGMVDEGEISLEKPMEPLRPAWYKQRTSLLPPVPMLPHPSHIPTYEEVLADLKIKLILDSLISYHRHGLAHHLWGHSEHFWLIQIITPITRLPPELITFILCCVLAIG